MFEKYPEVVTVPEVAEMLRIGKNSAYEIIRSGAIKSVKAGRSLRIMKSAVVDYLHKRPADMERNSVDKSRRVR